MTHRVRIRHLVPDDAPFILRLLNEPSFLRFIGDREVRTLDDAHAYLERGPMAGYARDGFHLNCVESLDGTTSMGICGVLRRETLPAPDLGYAFLPEYWGQGFALESAAAVMADAGERIGLARVLAITTPDNAASIRLLGKLGFVAAEASLQLQDGADPVSLYAWHR